MSSVSVFFPDNRKKHVRSASRLVERLARRSFLSMEHVFSLLSTSFHVFINIFQSKFSPPARMAEDEFTCRVQYIVDADPFATTSSSYLEPMRPVTFNFKLHKTIGDQIPDVIRCLRAPHKVSSALNLAYLDQVYLNFSC